MLFFEFFLSMLPILWLIIALIGLRLPGYQACLTSLAVAVVLAIIYWRLSIINTATAVLEGVLNGLWPISLVVVAALFTYNLAAATGAMETIKQMLGSVSHDRRILTLIVGWGFGNFMEGMAGFGTAVAIPASILAGVGMDPFLAVISCLAINTTTTAFGSVGIPISTLADITGIDVLTLNANATLIQSVITFLSPFLLVWICGEGKRAFRGMLLMLLVASFSFLIPWIIVARTLGPELPNIIGAIISMICMIVTAKLFYQKIDPEYMIAMEAEENKVGVMEGVRAWAPFWLIFLLLMGTSKLFPFVYNTISGIKTNLTVYAGEGANTLSFSWVNTPGVIIFIATFLGGWIQGARLGRMLRILGETIIKYWRTVVTICSVLSIAKVMSYSGMISDIASFLVIATGSFYSFIAPSIGALGGFITGSGTSTNILFGKLQIETAKSLSLNPAWMAAANVMGAGIGKMICPQSIAIGAGAINAVGSESKILSAVFKYFMFDLVVAGVVCFLGSFLGL